MKRVFVTGINGFIASKLCRHFSDRGFEVWGSTSQIIRTEKTPWTNRVFQIPFGSSVPQDALEGVHSVIHCAHVMAKKSKSLNLDGTTKIAKAAQEQGVLHQVFISSYSALAKNKTEYGETKAELEHYFRELHSAVVRPGLVVGNGGLFSRINKIVRCSPVVPAPNGGKGEMPIIWIEDLMEAIHKIVALKLSGEWNLFNDSLTTLKEFIHQVAASQGKQVFLLPIPLAPLEALATLAETTHIPLPISTDNLRGYRANQSIKARSDLQPLLGYETPLRQMAFEIQKMISSPVEKPRTDL